ncbi:13481_t:CDS:2 [Entrophospora sp. SA101]|nr:10599_t:CDS:2 [Entrophospora sp. SA101]CAJ0752427.1 13481_t:CDS:2 [Entrophospora sp. SA101]
MSENSDYVFLFSESNATHFQDYAGSQPPSYEEAINGSLDPTSVTINPLLNPNNNGRSVDDDPTRQQTSDENLPPPPEYNLSDAKFKRTSEGVTTCEPKLNREPESLYRFMLAHNDKPNMAIKIHGYHYETRHYTYTYTDANGNIQYGTRSETYVVTDFLITIDLSEYVLPNGTIHAIPNKKNPDPQIMDIINEYINHENKLKEFIMKKTVLWDYQSLTKAISTSIRLHGFHRFLEITYPLQNHKVKVQSDHKFAKFTRNTFTQK